MKLKLVSDPDAKPFDATAEVGTALVKAGLCEAVKEPTYNVVPGTQTQVTWTLTKGTFPNLKAECPVCHYGVQITQKLAPFKHCRRSDNAPPDLAHQFLQLLKQQAKEPRPERTAADAKLLAAWIS